MKSIDWKTENSGHFERHAAERLLPVYPWLLQDFINSVKQPLTDLTILEIGCGPGFMLQQFSKCSPRKLLGVDKSFAMLQAAMRKIDQAGVGLIQGDACSLPVADACVDAVFSRGSIFFWEDLHLALRHIKRCLKPGGIALIGGGYGLSTPQGVIDDLRQNDNRSSEKQIPRLNLDELSDMARDIGGNVEILHEKKRGFWLYWKL